jgi:hypothetical protein
MTQPLHTTGDGESADRDDTESGAHKRAGDRPDDRPRDKPARVDKDLPPLVNEETLIDPGVPGPDSDTELDAPQLKRQRRRRTLLELDGDAAYFPEQKRRKTVLDLSREAEAEKAEAEDAADAESEADESGEGEADDDVIDSGVDVAPPPDSGTLMYSRDEAEKAKAKRRKRREQDSDE